MRVLDLFTHAKVNAKSSCPKCLGTGQYCYSTRGTPHYTICNVCCKHDLGFWQLGEYHLEPRKWCCKAGCGYIMEFNPEVK